MLMRLLPVWSHPNFCQQRHIQLAKLPLFKTNEAKEHYRVFLWPGWGGTEAAVFVNQTWKGSPGMDGAA